jgi:hypothetical protein
MEHHSTSAEASRFRHCAFENWRAPSIAEADISSVLDAFIAADAFVF